MIDDSIKLNKILLPNDINETGRVVESDDKIGVVLLLPEQLDGNDNDDCSLSSILQQKEDNDINMFKMSKKNNLRII